MCSSLKWTLSLDYISKGQQHSQSDDFSFFSADRNSMFQLHLTFHHFCRFSILSDFIVLTSQPQKILKEQRAREILSARKTVFLSEQCRDQTHIRLNDFDPGQISCLSGGPAFFPPSCLFSMLDFLQINQKSFFTEHFPAVPEWPNYLLLTKKQHVSVAFCKLILHSILTLTLKSHGWGNLSNLDQHCSGFREKCSL